MIGIDDAVTAVSSLVGTVVSRIWPDATVEEQNKFKLLEDQLNAEMAPILAQLETNKIEAANPSIFVSGWRPGAGWVCVVGFGYTFLIQPVLTPFMQAISHWAGYPILLPGLDTGTMMSLLLALLGMGGMRSYDYSNGTARQNLNHNPQK